MPILGGDFAIPAFGLGVLLSDSLPESGLGFGGTSAGRMLLCYWWIRAVGRVFFLSICPYES